jgi:hypothetical protein
VSGVGRAALQVGGHAAEAGGQAAVDGDHGAGHERGIVRGQEEGDLLGPDRGADVNAIDGSSSSSGMLSVIS